MCAVGRRGVLFLLVVGLSAGLLGSAQAGVIDSHRFDTSNGWLIDWGFEVVLSDGWGVNAGGSHLDFQVYDNPGDATPDALAAGNSEHYTSSGYNMLYTVEDHLPAAAPIGGEKFDVEAMLMTGDSTYYYFLVLTSMPDHIGDAYASGDLAINPTMPWTPGPGTNVDITGNNRAKLSVKIAGNQAGETESNALWGYQWDASDYAVGPDHGDRDPLRDHGSLPRPEWTYGADGWGSNFVWGSGSGQSTAAGFNGITTIFGGTGDEPPNETLSTYAFEVQVAKSDVGTFTEVHYAPSCMNDHSFVRTPEPQTAALLLCSLGALVIRRRNRAK